MKLDSHAPAKTVRPVLSTILQRARLFRLLDHHLDQHPVLWVCGPPGSGKTTLVASYLESRGLGGYWYKTDPDDSDVATFFASLGAVLKQAGTNARRALPRFRSEHRQHLSAFVRTYWRECFSCLPPAAVIVLDDYHGISLDSDLHEVIAEGMRHIPSGIRMIAISQWSLPPDRFACLHGCGQMSLLGWNDLRLDREEAAALACLRHQGLAPQLIQNLHCRSDGWLAGFLHLLEQVRRDDSVSADPSFPDVLARYFAQAILEQQDRRSRTLLFLTSVLPTITGRAADELTGIPQATSILLDALHNRSLFVDKLHGHPDPIYRYHPLLREFLLTKAKTTFSPARLRTLQLRAATHLIASESVEEAIPLLREARAWKKMSQLIVRHAATMVAEGRHETLKGWIEILPEAYLHRNGWLQYWLGVCWQSSRPVQARLHYDRAFRILRGRGDAVGTYSAWCGAVESVLFEQADLSRLDRWIDELEDAWQHRLSLPVEVEGRFTQALFSALLFRRPHHPEIASWASRALAFVERTTDVSERTFTYAYLAHYYLWIGDLTRASALLEVGRPSAHHPNTALLARLLFTVHDASGHWHMARATECRRTVEEGLSLSSRHSVPLLDSLLYAQGFYGAMSEGDLRAASRWLAKMSGCLDRSRKVDVAHYHYLVSWHAIACQKLDRAFSHAILAVRLATRSGAPFFIVLTSLVLAYLQYQRGDRLTAGRCLTRARRIASRMNSLILRYMVLLVKAQWAFVGGGTGP